MKNSFQNFVDNQDILRVLSRNNKKINKTILNNCDKKVLVTICDICHNILKGTVKIEDKDLKKIKPFKDKIRTVLEKQTIPAKRKYLIQNGGFLQYLIPTIISSIIALKQK
jgi:hypothetical protein